MSFFQKLKAGLDKTKRGILGQINDVVKAFVKVDEEFLGELEEILIAADVGVPTAAKIISRLRDDVKEERLSDADDVKSALKKIIVEIIGGGEALLLDSSPSVLLVIGVNGAGKTTSVGKIANVLARGGKSVTLAAADTFRAAAAEQLAVWADRADVNLIRGAESSDPASVVFDAISSVKHKKTDVLIIDTAGRLHNKTNLMNELAKINRIIDREMPGVSRETLLVLDAGTGQNALAQAREFTAAAAVTGIVLTKLDGTAKGGVAIAVRDTLGIPIKFIGVGEKLDDMELFNAVDFAEALLGE